MERNIFHMNQVKLVTNTSMIRIMIIDKTTAEIDSVWRFLACYQCFVLFSFYLLVVFLLFYSYSYFYTIPT